MGEAGRHVKSGRDELGWESAQTSLALSYPQRQIASYMWSFSKLRGLGQTIE